MNQGQIQGHREGQGQAQGQYLELVMQWQIQELMEGGAREGVWGAKHRVKVSNSSSNVKICRIDSICVHILGSLRIPVNSSHGQVVTRSTRHRVNSSQSTRHNAKLCRRSTRHTGNNYATRQGADTLPFFSNQLMSVAKGDGKKRTADLRMFTQTNLN